MTGGPWPHERAGSSHRIEAIQTIGSSARNTTMSLVLRGVSVIAGAIVVLVGSDTGHSSPMQTLRASTLEGRPIGRLQARLDRGGGRVFLPRLAGGRCYTTRGLWVSHSGTHITSDGACLRVVAPGTVRLHSSDGDAIAATAAFFVSRSSPRAPPPSDVVISGLRIIVAPGAGDGIDVYGDHVRITGVEIEGSPLDGIYIGGRTSPSGRARYVAVTHSVVQRAARNAVSVTSAVHVQITGNVLAGAAGVAGPGAGVDVEPNAPSNPIFDVSIVDNFIVGNAGSGVELALHSNTGLPLRASRISIASDLIVGNALLRSNGGVLIAGGQLDGRGRVSIVGNRFESNGGPAVSLTRALRMRLRVQRNQRESTR